MAVQLKERRSLMEPPPLREIFSFFPDLHISERIVMGSTPRVLLRLHIEAVWGVQLPPITQNTVELLREGIQPPWKLYAAEMADEQVAIWRPDVAAP